MEDSQKLDFIIANMVTKEDIANMAKGDHLAEVESDILLEIDREQLMIDKHFGSIEECLGSQQSTDHIIELLYQNVNLLRKSAIELQSQMEMIGVKML